MGAQISGVDITQPLSAEHRDAIEQALNEAEIDWNEQLRAVWQRKFGQLPVDARERAQQGRFLAYRGYPLDLIGRLLRGLDD